MTTAVAEAPASISAASTSEAAPTSNLDTEAGVLRVQSMSDIPLEGNVTVSLAQVDITRYKNYRTEAKELHIMELMGLLKEHGQLNSCVGAWQSNGTIALVAGFCRFEAMERIALESLLREYNKANGKDGPNDEGFISLGGLGFDSRKNRIKVREAGGDWTKKYDAALAGYNINFSTVIVENDADAALKNIASNAYEKPPLLDLCRQIEKLLQQPDITAKKVAKALKLNETTVSLHRKINACPEALRKLFAGDVSDLAKKPEEQQVVRDSLLTAVAEFERRLALEQDNPQSISYSHAREFAGSVMHKDQPMTLAGVAKALKDLVMMHDNGKLSEAATPDYTVFMAKLKEAKRIGKVVDAAVTAAAAPGQTPATAGAVANPASTAVGNISTLSAEQQAQFDAASHTAAPPAAAPVSTGNNAALTAPAATVPAAVTTTPTLAPQASKTPEELARQAEIDAANSAEFVGTSTASLLDAEGDVPVVAAAAEAPTDGQTRSKTTDAPVATKYRDAKPPEKIENMANRMLDYAGDVERSTPAEQAGYMLCSANLFNACGLLDAETAVNESFVNFMEGLNKYFSSLENTVKEARGEAVLREIQQLKPVFVRPVLAK